MEKIVYLKTKDNEVWAVYNDGSQRLIRKGKDSISYTIIGVGYWEPLLERYKKVCTEITREEFWNEVQKISSELEEFQDKFVDWKESETLNEQQREALRYKTLEIQEVKGDAPF